MWSLLWWHSCQPGNVIGSCAVSPKWDRESVWIKVRFLCRSDNLTSSNTLLNRTGCWWDPTGLRLNLQMATSSENSYSRWAVFAFSCKYQSVDELWMSERCSAHTWQEPPWPSLGAAARWWCFLTRSEERGRPRSRTPGLVKEGNKDRQSQE